MDTEQEQAGQQTVPAQADHPWLEAGGNVDEDLRYTLDELRFS